MKDSTPVRRTAITLAFLTLGVAVLVGCGDSDLSTSAYCSAVAAMGDISAASTIASSDIVDKARKVAAVAPSDIKADWEACANSMEQTIALSGSGMPDMSNPAKALADLDQQVKNSARLKDSAGTVARHVETISART